jgi:hypothetical protein
LGDKILKILIILSLFKTVLFADDWDFLSLNGYGTLGAAYQDNKDVLYRSSIFGDRGTQGDISFDNYSLLGLQVDAQATDKLSFTIQAIVNRNNENGKLVDLEWANIKYQLTNSFDIKVGLMRLPLFMYSDILNVAYSYDWIGLPDMYNMISLNKYKGVELNHYLEFADATLLTTLMHGRTSNTVKSVGMNGRIRTSEIDAKDIYGLVLKLYYDSLTLRASYLYSHTTLSNEGVNGVLAQFNAMGIPIISNTIEKYKVDKVDTKYINLGARYDFENSYLMGEYVQTDSSSFMPNINSWNISAGYNFPTWTPYVVYSKTKSSSNYIPISTLGMPAQVAGAITGANQAFTSISKGSSEFNLETGSIGLRYDLSDNSVLKFQYDEQDRVDEKLHIFSASISFVF